MTDETNESSGETTETLSVVDDGIRKAIQELPEGTKERAAWEEHGEGKITREAFRDLWLEIRVPATKKPQGKK